MLQAAQRTLDALLAKRVGVQYADYATRIVHIPISCMLFPTIVGTRFELESVSTWLVLQEVYFRLVRFLFTGAGLRTPCTDFSSRCRASFFHVCTVFF